MSQLTNPHWIAFNGEPVTGRTPPSVIVYGPPMTAQQQGEVAHAYRLFTTANLLALGGYQVRNRTLSDGTRVRMLSINGVDTVQVWTGGSEEYNLGAFFYCVPSTNEASPYFSGKESAAWAYRGKALPPKRLKPTRTTTPSTGIRQHPGAITWFNPNIKARFPGSNVAKDTVVVSWDSWNVRYGIRRYTETEYGTAYTPNAYLWIDGVRRKIVKGATPVVVLSAALKQEVDGLYLYVVSAKPKLVVMRGKVGNLHAPSQIDVAELFEINYTNDANRDSTFGWSEQLLQPPYFNESCTQIASLVVVRKGSSVNAAADAAISATASPTSYGVSVALMTVDIASQSTSFTAEHARTIEHTTRSRVTDWPSGSTIYDIVNGAYTTEAQAAVETTVISYGAVDFVGDALKVVLVESYLKYWTDASCDFSMSRTITADGDWSVHNWVGNVTYSGARSIESRYSVYSTDASISFSRTFPTFSFGTEEGTSDYTAESRYLSSAGISNQNGDVSCTIVLNENYAASNDILLRAFISGGDIRFNTLVVEEIIENGECVEAASISRTQHVDYFERPSATDQAWPKLAFGGPSFSNTQNHISGSRALGVSVSAYVENEKILEAPVGTLAVFGDYRPRFGYKNKGGDCDPGAYDSGAWFLHFYPLFIGMDDMTVLWNKFDYIEQLRPQATLVHYLQTVNPPRARSVAFSTDGVCGVISLGQPAFGGAYVPTTQNKFFLNGAWVDAPLELPSGNTGSVGFRMAMPIFLNQAVEPLK